MMSHFTDDLGLDLQTARNIADAHFGYAAYLSTLPGERYRPYIASSFLIAAILRTLTNPSSAQQAFRRSAQAYQSDQNPYWKIVAVCGNDREMLNLPVSERGYQGEILPDHQFAELLGRQFLRSEEGRVDTAFVASVFPYVPVGRMGLPMHLYTTAFQELAELSGEFLQRDSLLQAWALLLNRAAERTRMLQADQYHWNTIKGNFIPLEPEVLAPCITLCRLLKAMNLSITSFIELLPADRTAKIPLLVAYSITGPDSMERT